MDILVIGKLNDWTVFTDKNLFGLIAKKAEISQTWKINRLTFSVPVPKIIEVIP